MDLTPAEREKDERGAAPSQRPLRPTPRELLRRIAGACDRVPATQWVRSGTPTPLLALALWITPFMLAGIIRYVVGAKLGLSLAVAFPAMAVLGGLWWARPKAPGKGFELAANPLAVAGGLIGFALVVWAFSLLYSFDTGALSIYFGYDGGTHIAQRRIFVESDPKVYAGFVTFYAATHLLDKVFSLAPPTSIALAFYSTVAAVVVVPVLAMTALLHSHPGARRPQLAGLAAFSVAWCWCLKSYALPVLSNMQVDGFYAHFFVLLPCALVWAADVLLTSTLLRIFGTGLVVLLFRFTYGLNLGDILVACGVLWLFDARRARRRALPLVAAVGAMTAGIVAYVNLAPIFRLGGYVEVYGYLALPKIMRSGVLALGAYGLVDWLGSARADGRTESGTPLGLLRVVRLPLVFAGTSLVALNRFANLPGIDTYYQLKYPLMPLVFLVAAISIAVGYTVLILMKRARPVLALTAIAASFVFGFLSVETNESIGVWQQELTDRTAPRPHTKLRALIDPEIWKTIQATLHKEGKAFGGFVTADLNAANVLQAWIGFAQTSQGFYPPDKTPGHCVFWTSVTDDPTFLWNPERPTVDAVRAALEQDPLKSCKTYDSPWTTAPRTFCHRCY